MTTDEATSLLIETLEKLGEEHPKAVLLPSEPVVEYDLYVRVPLYVDLSSMPLSIDTVREMLLTAYKDVISTCEKRLAELSP